MLFFFGRCKGIYPYPQHEDGYNRRHDSFHIPFSSSIKVKLLGRAVIQSKSVGFCFLSLYV
jgi:hypothetical protein